MARKQKRYHKRKRNPDSGGGGSSARRPGASEVAEMVLPGAAGFVGSRFLTRIAAVQVAKRAPGFGKHAGAIASVGVLAAAWLLANKWKPLARYQLPIVVGSAIATIQSLLQLYLPRIGWIVSDPMPDLAVAGGNQVLIQNGQATMQLPGNLQPVDDDPNMYVYDDRYDNQQSQPQQQPQQQQSQAPQGQGSGQTSQSDDDLLAQIEDEQSTQGLGIFAQ